MTVGNTSTESSNSHCGLCWTLLVVILIPIVKFLIPKSRKNVSGQLALITGGSEGIGRALAFRLAQEGCNIAIANRNLEKGQKTAEEIRTKFNVKVQAFQCDVSKREDVKRLKNEVKKSLGTVDLLINNAGLMPINNSVLEGDDEYYQYVMDVNLTSWIWTTRAFLPDMIKQKRGHIVGVSSLSYNCPIQNTVTYTATKYGNRGFIDGLREDMSFYGYDFIKTSTVFTGFVKTKDEMVDMISTYFHDEYMLFCEADKLAETVVDGILKNDLNIHASRAETLIGNLIYYLPRSIKKLVMRSVLKSDKRDEYLQMRLKNCKLLD
ncbi:uncharacterized oxidoreductase SSP0419-like [Chironomus tepperi]|uniref:uncharacterized oxidoreductase SSP0419-like n=1 Tax=Chironomus tepperi TaxID=113505 RepID=UPI00391F458C